MGKILLALALLVMSLGSALASPMPTCSTTGQALAWDSTNGFQCMNMTAPSSTVASLPTCNAGTAGALYLVTNALAPVALSVVVGGGLINVSVICNGTNWVVQ